MNPHCSMFNAMGVHKKYVMIMTQGTYSLVGDIRLCMESNRKHYRIDQFSHELSETEHECQNISEEREIRVDQDQENLPRVGQTSVGPLRQVAPTCNQMKGQR